MDDYVIVDDNIGSSKSNKSIIKLVTLLFAIRHKLRYNNESKIASR